MNRKTIFFTEPHVAKFLDDSLPELMAGDVLVQMEYTVVSGGTERAVITAAKNTAQTFPCAMGYCGVGRVTAVGDGVTSVVPGDRVLVYHGVHSNYNIRKEAEITKIEQDSIASLEAAFVVIASMGLGGVRKLEVEIGESAMVIGLGLLGIFSVQFCRLNGAYPVIAADPNPQRRELALQLGADFAFDPMDPDFVENVMKVTGGRGVNACVEVTGSAAALQEALNCASQLGRISLLGCTRVSDCEIDYYTQVHRPGIRLIGAHNFVRPKLESYPHHWTHQDDCKAILSLIAAGRIRVKPIISRVVAPTQATEIFNQLCDDPMFLIGTVFDWRDY